MRRRPFASVVSRELRTMPYRERPRVALEYGLVQLAETNCPITDDAPPASENSIDETIEFSSHTVPQRTQTAAPRASSGSMSFDPHDGHWSDMVGRRPPAPPLNLWRSARVSVPARARDYRT